MTTETRPLSQNGVVRHYRGGTRSDVEVAYRADALKAARAGYVAIDQAWTEDAQGFVLAVTYAGPATDDSAQRVEPEAQAAPEPVSSAVAPAQEPAPAPGAEPAPAPAAEPAPAPVAAPRTYQPVQRIAPAP